MRAGCARAFIMPASMFCFSVNISVFVSPIYFICLLQYYDTTLGSQNFFKKSVEWLEVHQFDKAGDLHYLYGLSKIQAK
jgi:hypothetical protein